MESEKKATVETSGRTRRPDFCTQLWEAIQAFRAENPGLDRFEGTFADGTKVLIRLPKIR